MSIPEIEIPDTATQRRARMLAITGEPACDERVAKDAYVSPQFAERETRKLWPRIWQVACREEEIVKLGSYVEYEIAGQSVVVVRSAPNSLRAFHNVCQHRGRKLVSGSGTANGFRCGYHGWRYDLDGACTEITDGSDYVKLCPKDVRLKEIRLETWAGFVYVNLNDQAEPLRDFLAPVPTFLDPFELGEMRISWYKSTLLRANWKTVMDGFIEGYHVPATHSQNMPFFDRKSLSFRRGKHSNQTFAPDSLGFGVPDRNLRITTPEDPRVLLKRYMDTRKTELDAIFTDRHREAAEQVMQELPEGTPATLVMKRFAEIVGELQVRDGSANLHITMEQLQSAAWDWHVFPNLAILPSADGALCYRFRPEGADADRSIMDIWSLIRFPPGKAPPYEHQFFSNWRDGDWGRVLKQDFSNFEMVQRGMHTDGFTSLLINPIQETAISNYHRILRGYLFDEHTV